MNRNTGDAFSGSPQIINLMFALTLATIGAAFIPAQAHAQQDSNYVSDDSAEKARKFLRSKYKNDPTKTKRAIDGFNERLKEAADAREQPQIAINEIQSKIEQVKSNWGTATVRKRALGELELILQKHLDVYQVKFDTHQAASVSDELIDITKREVSERAEHFPEPERIAQRYVPRYGAGRRAKEYVLDLLQNVDLKKQAIALSGINQNKHFVGNAEIYDGIEKSSKKDLSRRHDFLTTLQRLNPQRALSAIYSEIETTKDPQAFSHACQALANYREPTLLDAALNRVDRFPDPHATLGLPADLLLEYVEIARGNKLSLGLKALSRHPSASRSSYKVVMGLMDRVDSGDQARVLEFIETESDRIYNRETVIDDLEKKKAGTNDSILAARLNKAIRNLKTKFK